MKSEVARVQRLALRAQQHGLRLVTSTIPVGYILVNARKVVEFGAFPGQRRATLDEVESYLNEKLAASVVPTSVIPHRVRPRRRPRWMKPTSWP
jgi:hypothetical protein